MSPSDSRPDNTRVTAKTDPYRYEFVLRRLAGADGPSYDELVRAVAVAFPEGRPWTGVLAARAVRGLLWEELAVTEPDESVWLTPAGWTAVAVLEPAEARRQAS